ncbi:MAG: leucine-rich repeat protein [Bacilli bacterium]
MRDRKKRNIIIGVLCCLLVFMGIGYAILSQTLTINGIGNVKGKWDVQITSIALKSQTGRATEVSSSYTKTTASFEADLYMPGDSIEYEVTVENKGNIDALLQSITPTTTNKVADIKFSHSEIDNTPLTAGKTITFTMKVEFLESATAIPDVERTEYQLELVYIQYDGVSDYTPAVEPTEESCFVVDSEGTLLHYNYDCGTDVVVPATVNGTAVKTIAGSAFNDKSMAFSYGVSDANIIVFDNEDFQKYLNAVNKTVDSSTNQVDIDGTTYKVYMYDDADVSDAIYTLPSDLITTYGADAGYKLTDSDGTITVEASTTDPNFYVLDEPYGYICDTQEICEKVKKYIRDNDPANPGDDLTYSEYVGYDKADAINSMPFRPISTKYYLSKETDLDAKVFINMMNGLKFSETEEGYLTGASSTLTTLDFSNAIYLEGFASYSLMLLTVDKLVMPPNIELIGNSDFLYNNVGNWVFPKNSKLKAIGQMAFAESQISSIEIPASVKSIGMGAFHNCGITNLTFETGSQLIAIYSDRDNFGAFEGNNLTQVRMPSTLKYMATDTFYNNPNLTQITLTSATDIDNWPDGGTVNGATVIYER